MLLVARVVPVVAGWRVHADGRGGFALLLVRAAPAGGGATTGSSRVEGVRRWSLRVRAATVGGAESMGSRGWLALLLPVVLLVGAVAGRRVHTDGGAGFALLLAGHPPVVIGTHAKLCAVVAL